MRTYTSLLLSLALIFALAPAVASAANWSDPGTGNTPENYNTPPPINVDGSSQWKQGGLSIGRSNTTDLTGSINLFAPVSKFLTLFAQTLNLSGTGAVNETVLSATGNAAISGRLQVTGNALITGNATSSRLGVTSLAGSGTRMVVADPVGNLRVQAIPTGGGGTMSTFTLQGFNGIGLKEGTGVLTTSPVTVNNGDAITVQMGQCVSGSIFKSVNGLWACYGNQPGEFTTDNCGPGQVLKLDANNIWKCGTDNTGTSGGSGTVTSVGLTVPTPGTAGRLFGAVAGSPVTGAGTLGITLNNQNANTVFAGPASGVAASPTFRALTATDIPTGQKGNLVSGTGITLTPSAGTLAGRVLGAGNVTVAADTNYIQRRVTGVCAAGSSISAIAADGTVTCETDDTGTGGDGVVESIAVTGTGAKTITLGRSGTLPDLTASFVDADAFGKLAFCPAGQVLEGNATGNGWVCGPDDNTGTAYTPGTGISIANNVITNTAPNVTHTGDVVGTAGSAALTIAPNAVTSAKILDGTIGTADIANGAITSDKILNANVTFPKLAPCATAGHILKWNGTAWACTADSGAISGLTSNFLPKWNGSTLVNSFVHDELGGIGYRTVFNFNTYTGLDSFVNRSLGIGVDVGNVGLVAAARGRALTVMGNTLLGGQVNIAVLQQPSTLSGQSLLVADADGLVRKIDPSLVIPSLGPVTTRVGVYMDMVSSAEGCALESGLPHNVFAFSGGLDQGNYGTSFRWCNNRFKGLGTDGTFNQTFTNAKNNYLRYMAFRFKKNSCSITKYLNESPTPSDYVELNTGYVASEIVLTCN